MFHRNASSSRPSANEGEGGSIATIDGDTAIFKPEGAEEECQIMLKFTDAKLVITQTGICGFGHNVGLTACCAVVFNEGKPRPRNS